MSPLSGENCHVHEEILCCLNIAIQEFTWKKNLIFKQSAAPTLANARWRRHRPAAGGGAWACWDKIYIQIYFHKHTLKMSLIVLYHFIFVQKASFETNFRSKGLCKIGNIIFGLARDRTSVCNSTIYFYYCSTKHTKGLFTYHRKYGTFT